MSQPSTTPVLSKGVTVRPATPRDLAFIVTLVGELAAYEKLSHAVDSTEEQFGRALFGAEPKVFCTIAERDGQAGGLAIWFYNFSTFRGRHGLYIEDIYVRPSMRSHGLGKALLKALAQRCVTEDLPRMEWSVLDWNAPAIDFYRGQGAELLDDWQKCRLTGDALTRLGGAV